MSARRDEDVRYMRRALALARRAAGRTRPNPMVGAVVVREGRVVGEGYHRQAGTPHAEVHALQAAGPLARGATLYVSLEPCAHHGRTPPCTDAILAAGIRRVVAATVDPNPLVAGRGLERLRRAGLEVATGVLEEEARELNAAFFKYITAGRPLVTFKYAMTLDGKVASRTGAARWISSPAARRLVHRWRAAADAVVVGVGTVLADDPELTVRLVRGRDPVRVVVDSRLRTPASARVVAAAARSPAPTWIATTELAPPERRAALAAAGAEVLVLPARGGRVDLHGLLAELARREITGVLLEGGPTLAAAFLEEGLVDRVAAFVCPLLLGGVTAPGPVGGAGRADPAEALPLQDVRWRRVGDDLLVTARPAPPAGAAEAALLRPTRGEAQARV